ncbi:zinc finger protein 185 isoform X2 [Toxotes jaculatrix]|uniref:zinc finger protein 185 isoform X2 n=1 Tax=Toxotes jaculatrix TaxID=941984 RepID=UPI001B3AD1CD|nr:zinc finger protein 185 isoform X2 [Toxotes jaculatrix]
MSKDVDRNQVFKTTRVRTALKNDGSWIHKSEQEKGEQNKPRTDHAVETMSTPVRQKSYVLSTAKKFESTDSPQSSSLEKTQPSPSEGDSANQANIEVIPLQKDAQPEVSTVETTDNTKPQAPTEELFSGEAQPEKNVANTAAENKEESADTPVAQLNVEHGEKAVEVYADVHVEPDEQPVANTAAENKGENADTTAEQSNEEHTEAKASADAHVEDPVLETSDVAGTEQSKDPAEAELKPEEEPSIETEPTNATQLEDVQPAEGSCKKYPPEHAAEEIFEAVAVVVVESSSDTSDVIHSTPGEEAALQNSVEQVPDLLVESVFESPTQCATETTTEEGCERCPPEQSSEETVEAEVVVESSPETPAVNNATPRDEASLQGTVESALDVSESPTQSAAETAVESVESKVEPAAPTESVFNIRAEVVECEVHPVDNTVVEQSVEPAPENAADHVIELSIEDALEPVPASEGGEVQFSDRAIELIDALDVEPSTPEAPPKPVEDTQQSHGEESKPNQSDDTNTTDMFQKPREEQQSTYTLKETRNGEAVCSFCDQIIDGNVKLTLSEPLVTCHADCLKCGVCAKILGDLTTPMFLHDQVIHCRGCFAKTLEA